MVGSWKSGAFGGLVLVVVAAACSGSSSETPWPVEPNEIEQGPVGEQRSPTVDLRKVPSRYPQREAGASVPEEPTKPGPSTPPEESGNAP